MNYKSPLCSCIICHATKSAAGIFGHYYSKHDPVGSAIMADIRRKGTDATFRDPEFVKKNNQRRNESKPLKIFKNICNNTLCSKPTNNSKFCSHRCSAIVTNGNRTNESYKKQAATLIENRRRAGLESKKKPRERKQKLPMKRICTECGKIDFTMGRFQSDKCSFCSDSLTYRNQCKFKFSLKDFPEEFDFELLNEHGMFNPQKNPKGVSRDHMLSVHYGKMHRISPEIISHPANCRLVLQGDNTRKQSDSSITYENLIIRIKQWDIKYGRVAEPGFEPELALDVSGV